MLAALAPGHLLRQCWLERLRRCAEPVLSAAAAGRLRSGMVVERRADHDGDGRPSALEALARTLAGIAPWLELDGLDGAEAALQARMRGLATAAIDRWSDPASGDHMPLDAGRNALVEAGFLGHALVRSPFVLGGGLAASVRDRVVGQLSASRRWLAYHNNWYCFSGMAEAGIAVLGGEADQLRLAAALRQHEAWYLGDGHYGDGEHFHADYYNSYVMHPMLLDLSRATGENHHGWPKQRPAILARARRYAAIQERMVAPDGSFPVIGRSIAYRCGAFQLLAQCALQDLLPEDVAPAQVRTALEAVQARTLDPAGNWRADGFLAIGLCAAQPGLGESYISTGSCYLATTALLPLGLPPAHPFWTDGPQPYTGLAIWSGENRPADHALHGHGRQMC
ncbi:MAG TPA: hypothetical protein DCS97_05465 [Planctomycetes bacterium]|nr:hypothetical protein [Planctomycetota bacterium]